MIIKIMIQYIIVVCGFLNCLTLANQCATLTMPAFRRGFSVGQLYDARTDKIVHGQTLWNSSSLVESQLIRTNVEDTVMQYKIVQTTSQRINFVSASVELRLKFLFLPSASTSARYMRRVTKTNYQASLSFMHKRMTHSFALRPEMLSSITYPSALTQSSATHLVTKVTYGANSIFEFSRHANSRAEARSYEGGLIAKAALIPVVLASGGSMASVDAGQDESDEIKAEYYGDIELTSNPSNMQEAIEAMRTLSADLTSASAVDVEVALMPISCIPGATNRVIVQKISVHLQNQVLQRFDNHELLLRELNDLRKEQLARTFPSVNELIMKYTTYVTDMHDAFSESVKELLPMIRGGGKPESELSTLLTKNPVIDHTFVRSRSTEGAIVSNLGSIYEHFITQNELTALTVPTNHPPIVALSLGLCPIKDCSSECQPKEDFQSLSCSSCLALMSKSWTHGPFLNELQLIVNDFKSLIAWNQNTEIRFVVTDGHDPSEPANFARLTVIGPSGSKDTRANVVTISDVEWVHPNLCSASPREIKWTIRSDETKGLSVNYYVTTNNRQDLDSRIITSIRKANVTSLTGAVKIEAFCAPDSSVGRHGPQSSYKCGHKIAILQLSEQCQELRSSRTACSMPDKPATIGFSCTIGGSDVCLNESYVLDGVENCDHAKDETICAEELDVHCTGLSRLWNQCVFEPESHSVQCECNQGRALHTSGKCYPGSRNTCVMSENGKLGFACKVNGIFKCMDERTVMDGTSDCDQAIDENWCQQNAEWQLHCPVESCYFDRVHHSFSCRGLCPSNQHFTGVTSFVRQPAGTSSLTVTSGGQTLASTYQTRITAAKDQGSCRGSWAFAIIAMLESQYLNRVGKIVDLSEQALISCTDGKSGMAGCSGADLEQSVDHVLIGIVMSERAMPYVGANTACDRKGHILARIASLVRSCRRQSTQLSLKPRSRLLYVDSIDRLKRWIRENGAVVFAFNVHKSFHTYWAQNSTEVYRAARLRRDAEAHAVLAFGWDDTKRAIKLKNSWGSCGPLGDGTFYLSYDDAAQLNYHAAIIDLPWECIVKY